MCARTHIYTHTPDLQIFKEPFLHISNTLPCISACAGPLIKRNMLDLQAISGPQWMDDPDTPTPCLRIPAESEQASGRPWSRCCSLSLQETDLGYSGALRVSVFLHFCCHGVPCLPGSTPAPSQTVSPPTDVGGGRGGAQGDSSPVRVLENRTQETFPTPAHRPSWLLAPFRWGGLQRAPEAR